MEKKVYESKKIYSKKYNKLNINVQLNRELIDNLRKKLENQGISIKDYIENLIKNDN
jgi:predicted DNA binding CopG/RHH family protein